MASTLRELRTRIRVPKNGRGRGTKKLSQNDVAVIVGVSVMTVWKWENGHAMPHPDCRPLYAKILGVTEAELERAIEATYSHAHVFEETTPLVDPRTEIVIQKTRQLASHPDADQWRVGTLLHLRGEKALRQFELYYAPCGFEILEEKITNEHQEEQAARVGDHFEVASAGQSGN
jgi:transcriptional regulator with XRE-family HTH domain